MPPYEGGLEDNSIFTSLSLPGSTTRMIPELKGLLYLAGTKDLERPSGFPGSDGSRATTATWCFPGRAPSPVPRVWREKVPSLLIVPVAPIPCSGEVTTVPAPSGFPSSSTMPLTGTRESPSFMQPGMKAKRARQVRDMRYKFVTRWFDGLSWVASQTGELQCKRPDYAPITLPPTRGLAGHRNSRCDHNTDDGKDHHQSDKRYDRVSRQPYFYPKLPSTKRGNETLCLGNHQTC